MSWSDASTKPKRFYKDVTIRAESGGYAVLLDDRPLRTPAQAPLIAPQAAAQLVADEWNAQTDVIDPMSMPATRTVNSAIDRVAPARDAVIDDVAAYGGTDLLCYRADGPTALVARQSAGWDPLLAWARETLSATLSTGAGVMFVAQSAEAQSALRKAVAERNDISLAALHELTTLSGSLVLALAVDHGRTTPSEAWSLSRIDEEWQIEQWGRDAEAAEATTRRAADFQAAARLIAAVRRDPAG